MKNRIVWKMFTIWQWEEEEAWLNGMAAKGWHLVSVKWFRYEFERGEPGAYQYRLVALEDARMGSPKAQDYLAFMRDAGAEYVGHVLYWAYFRNAVPGETFEVFSDIDSKLKHMERFEKIPLYVLPLTALNCINCWNLIANHNMAVFGCFLLGVNIGLLGVLGYASYRLRGKRKELEEERQLHE